MADTLISISTLIHRVAKSIVKQRVGDRKWSACPYYRTCVDGRDGGGCNERGWDSVHRGCCHIYWHGWHCHHQCGWSTSIRVFLHPLYLLLTLEWGGDRWDTNMCTILILIRLPSRWLAWLAPLVTRYWLAWPAECPGYGQNRQCCSAVVVVWVVLVMDLDQKASCKTLEKCHIVLWWCEGGSLGTFWLTNIFSHR